MLLESSPLITAESAPGGPASARRGAAQSVSGASGAAYALVRDEVEAGRRKTQAAPAPSAHEAKGFSPWQNGNFGFGDFIDVINPLQHIPIVATIYRNLSGDQIGMAPRVIGGALWGRIGGFVAGIINSAVEWFTGKDIGDHIYTAIRGTSDASAVAHAPPPKPRSSAPEITEAAPATIPLSGRDPSSEESERHSALLPSPRVLSQVNQSPYRHDVEDAPVGAKPPSVRLRA